MFKFERNLPPYYVENSRDFQLISRLMEIPYNSSQIYSENLSTNALSLDKVVDNILPLLAVRLGLFSYKNYPNNILRIVLQNFLDIIKKKGTKRAVELVVTSYYIANNLTGSVLVASGRDLDIIENSDYSMIILLTDEFVDLTLLDDLLSYIMPAGTDYYMAKASISELEPTLEQVDQSAIILSIHPGDFGNLKTAWAEYSQKTSNDLMSTTGFTEVTNNPSASPIYPDSSEENEEGGGTE